MTNTITHAEMVQAAKDSIVEMEALKETAIPGRYVVTAGFGTFVGELSTETNSVKMTFGLTNAKTFPRTMAKHNAKCLRDGAGNPLTAVSLIDAIEHKIAGSKSFLEEMSADIK